MASLRVLAFDHEGRPVQFDTWLDDLQLYLLSDSKNSVSLFDLELGAATAPPATAHSSTCSQWLTCDAAARLAIRNHLPLAECAHFGQHRTAQALYDAVVARYSSPATASLGRLILPYLFPELSAFTKVEDLVSHLRASDARYRAAVPAEDHFLSLDPTSLTNELLEQHLLAAETSAVAVGAARSTPRPPFFEGCSPSPLAPSYASAAAAHVSVPEDVGAASASAKRRSSKGKGGRGGGGGSGGGGGGSGSGGGGSSGGGGGGVTVGGSGGFGGGGGGTGGSGSSGGGGSGGTGTRHVGSGGGQRQQQQRRSETPSPQQLREWFLRVASWGSCPSAIFDLDFDAILSAMYALSVSAEGDCYQCVPPDPGIGAAALGASESGTLPGTAPAQALHTFMLDSGASRCFFLDSTTLTPLPALVPVRLADPSGGPVMARSSTVLPCPADPSGSMSGLHLPPFSTNLVSTAALQDAMVITTTPGGQRVSICTCTRTGRHLATFTRRPWSLPPLPPSPAPPCLPCIEWRQRATRHSSSFPLTTAPLQTLHMDVWGPARVSGRSRERYFLLVVDDYTRYTTVFPLRSKGQVVDVLIPWIRTLRLQLRERFGQDLPVLRLHSDRGGDFSSTLLRDFVVGRAFSSRSCSRLPVVETVSRLRPVLPGPAWRAPRPLPHTPRFPSSVVAGLGTTRSPSDTTWRTSAVVGRLSSRAPRQGPAPSGVSQVDPLPGPAPVQVAVDSGAARGAASGSAEPGCAESEGAETGGAEPASVERGGAESKGVESGGAEPQGAASNGGSAGASPRLSPQQLREWFVWCSHLRSGASGAGGAGAARAGGPGVAAGAGVTRGTATTGPGGARTRGTGAAGTGGVEGAGAGVLTESGTTGVGGAGAGGAGAGGPSAGGAGVGGPGVGGGGGGGAGAVDPGGTKRPQLYFVPLLQQVLGTLPSSALTPPLPSPTPDQSQPPLQPASPSPNSELSGALTERCEPASRLVSPVRTARRVPHSRPPPVPGTHAMTLRPSSVPLRVPLPAPPESSLPEVPDSESDHARAASPTVSCLIATAVIDPSFESALVAKLLDFATACCLDYAIALVAESAYSSPPSARGECALGTDVLEDRQEDFDSLPPALCHC
ncbi:unnamed protein product [Closterium sp. NIES-54]